MRLRLFAPIFLLLAFVFSIAGVQASGNPKALALVSVREAGDLSRFAGTGLPLYARLTGSAEDLLLTGGSEEKLQSLAAAGLAYRVLDAGANNQTIYLVNPMPGMIPTDWAAYGEVLWDGGDRQLIRASSQQAEGLNLSGAEIQRIFLTPKPLAPAAAGNFPKVVDPDPFVQSLIDQVTTPIVQNMTGGLSGETPVNIGGNLYTIATRNTYSGTPIQKATQYVGEQMAALGMDVEYHIWSGATYPNVIGEIPGQTNPDDIYIIGAHLDDMPSGAFAPGADDNGSGSTATLLAAQIFSQYDWGCTLRFAFWTGEEQGLLGSYEYAERAYNQDENILGYLNLDMIAWNSGGTSPGIDLHAKSSLPATLTLAQLFADVVDAYNLPLIPQIVPNGSGSSDHASFWQFGYTSILGIEDFGDFNPYYHTTSDDMDNFEDWPYYTDFVKASLATFAHMADCELPPPQPQVYLPLVQR